MTLDAHGYLFTKIQIIDCSGNSKGTNVTQNYMNLTAFNLWPFM